MEEEIGFFLKKNGFSLSIAESCTGGYLSNIITSVPGASNYFILGMVVYTEQMKTQELGVSKKILEQYSVYSSQVAEAMAAGIRKKSGSTFSVSTTGIAPPGDKKTKEPTGLVYIGFSSERGVKHKKFIVDEKSRNNFKKEVAKKTFEFLKENMEEYLQ